MISAAQSKAARALLDWSQTDLASASGLSESTIRDFEKNRRVPSLDSLTQIRRTLESSGVIFIDNGRNSEYGGDGVRLLEADTKEMDNIELKIIASALNQLQHEIVMFDHKIDDALKDDDFIKREVHFKVMFRFKDVYYGMKREYEALYKKIYNVDISRKDDELDGLF